MLPGDISAANTTLAPGVSTTSGLFMEMFITAQLVFMVYMLAQEKSRDTFIAPIGIGLALFSAILPGTQPITPSLSFSTPIASP
jgi:aquaporin related protein